MVYHTLSNFYNGKTHLLGCLVPCLQVEYSYTAVDFHKNTWIDTSNVNPPDFNDKYYSLYVSYGFMDIERHEEALIYDSGNFFAAVGGNLGLFLGFSCLSIIFAGIDYLAFKVGK